MTDVRTIAFYLPQFHPIPENDEWWGEGFTEWTQVRRSTPMYSGHRQPLGPAVDVGYYDLRDVGVMARQFDLARSSGVDAFCIYHYWFSGHRLLEKPVELLLASDVEATFCLCWANENWSRRWDGKDHEVLVGQEYEAGWARGLLDSLLPALLDQRYLRVDGRAVLVVHRADLIPDCAEAVDELRQLARDSGVGELLLIAAESKFGLDPRPLGFDATCEFPPLGVSNLSTALLRPVEGLRRDFRGRLMSYARIATRYQRRTDPDFVRYRSVMPGWDNTPRRLTKSMIYIGSSPPLFHEWLTIARRKEAERKDRTGLVFINAWNEWGEGATLEPSELFGSQFLSATRGERPSGEGAHSPKWGFPSRAFLHSLGILSASSLLHAWRRLRLNRWTRSRS